MHHIRTLPTLPTTYKNYVYWIDGIPESTLHYYIQFPQSEESIASQESFQSVVAANFAARQAIDRMDELKDGVEKTDTVTESKAPKTTRRRAGSK